MNTFSVIFLIRQLFFFLLFCGCWSKFSVACLTRVALCSVELLDDRVINSTKAMNTWLLDARSWRGVRGGPVRDRRTDRADRTEARTLIMRNAARMEGVTRPFCFELTREDVDFDDGRRKHSWRVNPHSRAEQSRPERSGDDKCDVIKNQTAKCTAAAAAAAAATGDDGGGRGSGTDRPTATDPCPAYRYPFLQ